MSDPYQRPGAPARFQAVMPPHVPPRRSRLPLVLGLLALVLLLGVGAWFLATGNRPRASASPTATAIAAPSTPGGTASPVPTGTTPLPTAGTPSPSPSVPGSPTPQGSMDPAVAAQIDEVTEQVVQVRGLPPQADVPSQIVSRQHFRAELQRLLDQEIDPEQLAAEERFMKRVGLLPTDADLDDLLFELYAAAVAAYYLPETGTFYVLQRDAPFGPADRLFVAHEYTHALQDQHFDLEAIEVTDVREGDAQLATLALVEGDATHTMYQWAYTNLAPSELFEVFTQSISPADQQLLEGMPPVLRRQLEFPYLDGWAFVHEVHSQGGWSAVNQAFPSRPTTTEQVLHPGKYLSREEPVDVVLPADLAARLGNGWQQPYEETIGELTAQVWLADGAPVQPNLPDFPGMPGGGDGSPAERAAAGWGGDRAAMYEGPNGEWAIVWRTAWDSPEDAAEFEAAVAAAMADLDGVHQVAAGDANSRTVLVAGDAATLERLATALASG